MFNYKTLPAVAAAILVCATQAGAAVIDNDIASGTLGHLAVDVTTGGESRTGNITANGQVSGLTTTEVIYDYFSYVDVGNGGFRLSGSAPSLTGDDEVMSSGSFIGSGGNTIDWSVTSSIASSASFMQSAFSFSASQGVLGDISFFQYLDEDVLGASDDVFFTRGTAVGGDLELFTVDDNEVIGVSHGGAYSDAQGLENATFEGYAADTYNSMKPRIGAGNQTLSLTGVIEADLAAAGTTNIPGVGQTLGTADIVSVLGWSVGADATSATIITTLGGVPDITDIPPDPNVVPLPASLPLMLVGFGSFVALRRRKKL